MENQQTVLDKIEEKINNLENRVSGMRTEFRNMLNLIRGEVEETGIRVDIGQNQMIRQLKGIGLVLCGIGMLAIGWALASYVLKRCRNGDLE